MHTKTHGVEAFRGSEQPKYTDNFSFFNAPVKNVTPSKNVTLKEVHSLIIGDKYKDTTLKIRTATGSNKSTIKTQQLDYVTFAGTFSKRANNSLLTRSNYICIDVDDVDDVVFAKLKIRSGIEPALLFTSPSGNGVKTIYRIDPEAGTHNEYFTAIFNYYTTFLNIDIDPSGKDISRACFLCHDPNAEIRENSQVIGENFINKYKSNTYKDITYNLQPSAETNVKKQVIGDNKTNGCESSTYKGITYNLYPPEKTIFDFAEIMDKLKIWLDKKMSFVPGGRNVYIMQLAAAYNRYGVPQDVAENNLLSYQQHDFPTSEIKGIVKKIYRNTSFFGTAQFTTISHDAKRNDIDINFHRNENITTAHDAKRNDIDIQYLPIDGLPDLLQNFIQEYTKAYSIPQDYISGSVLFACALALGNKLELIDKYDNVPILWFTLVGDPSTGKTNPLKTALGYFLESDKASFKKYGEEKKLFDEYNSLSKKEKEKAEKVEKPGYFQYLLGDYTPESLYRAHQVNERGICIYRDELKGWLDDFNRYNKSGEQSSMLSTFFRQPMAINRAGSEPINISDPCIFVAGGIQPDLLPDLAEDKRAESGFLARLLFVYPDDEKGKSNYSTETLSNDTLKAFYALLHELNTLPEDKLKLSNEARQVYANWYNNNAKLTNEADTGYLKGVYGKFDVYALRIAIILKGLNIIDTGDASIYIDEKTMQDACNIVEYFRHTALKVFAKVFANKNSVDKKDVIKFLHECGVSQSAIARMIKVSQPYVNKVLKQT